MAELKELAQHRQIQPQIGQDDEPTSQNQAEEPRRRAPPKCSKCGIQGHKITRYLN
jgi:hypothetical protein